jgi:DNA-binding SARP family transcriptional activator/EAL domain-containing protein (putative c-di-GMP-specific phosphodiesterase class I)/FixJ family two-component response regulator
MGAHDTIQGLEVRLLGPFAVARRGSTVHIGSPKQRAVLALLALHAGKVVSRDTLCDLVWDEDQPASPAATLQSLVSRLRGALSGASGALRTSEPGWVLDVEPDAVDALRFRELAGRARLRSARGEADAAAVDLAAAVALWRGDALVDVVEAGYLRSEATWLNEARLDAVEDLAEAELATGRPADALARLERHVDDHPLRERGWGLLMVGLYRLGRQAAALRAFQQVRGLLDQELGIEPSPALVEIERQILHHDPALAGMPARGLVVGGSPPAAVQPSPARAAATSEFADYSVVVVDDHDFQRRTVVALLRGLGVGKVTDASSGAEGLELLRAGAPPDIIVCDIDMPEMDGVEFVTRVSERNLACAVVIASGLEPQVLRAVEAIGQSHGLQILGALEKPLTARRLGEVLRQYARLNVDRGDHGDRTALGGEALRKALANGEVTTHFTPRVDLATGGVSSAEAAGVWPHPDGAPIAGSALVDAVAREGLALAFVERLVDESCALVDRVVRAGLDANGPFRVAVSVTLLPLADASLADRLTEMVQSHSQDPRRFVCEIEDVALAKAPAGALSVLTRLRVKGFRLSLRHSGSGPSWTHQLGRVPLSELKVDRRLVSAVAGDAKRLAVLEAVTATAREAGLDVVADGCDSQADFDTVLALGCSEAQGRFIAEPLPVADMVAWARHGYRPDEAAGRR